MSYWNEKDGRLSFETQLKIEFLPPHNSSKNCLEKSTRVVSVEVLKFSNFIQV